MNSPLTCVRPRVAQPRAYKPHEYGELAEMLSVAAGVGLWGGILVLLAALNRYVVHRGLTQENADTVSGGIMLVAIGFCIIVARCLSKLLKKWLEGAPKR